MKKRLLPLLCLTVTALGGLSGCETMRGGMDSIGESVSSIRMPNWFGGGVEKQAPAPETVQAGQCPPITIVPELREIHQFADTDRKGGTDLASSLIIKDANATCTIRGKDMVVDLHFAFEGTLGPRARMVPGDKPRFSYAYFLAAVDGSQKILSKDVFAVNLAYGPQQEQAKHTETIRQTLPGAAKLPADHYRILIGFQLSEDELAYNRARLSAPPPAEDIGLLGPYPKATVEKIVLHKAD